MELSVTIQIGGIDVPVGILFTHSKHGLESVSFAYDSQYLNNPKAFKISPDLPLTPGIQQARSGAMFAAFSDTMPDRWGRNLLLREESYNARLENRTSRTLLESDFLCGVSDIARQGALRFWHHDVAQAPLPTGVPREIALPTLLSQADSFDSDTTINLKDLIEAGSSLGGARPKASVRNEQNVLMIAKFPKAHETMTEDICAWEQVALKLAHTCNIRVPATRLVRIDKRAILLLERFDRDNDRRIPYLSGLSAIQGVDGGFYSYLELAEFLEEEGSQPQADIPELWRRILFSCLIGNTDDHMRNHGFLWDTKGWRLSPAFDINPTPGNGQKFLRNAIDLDDNSASVELVLKTCEYYRVSPSEAQKTLSHMKASIAHWQSVARSCGISPASIEYMRTCFEG
ncbi:MAG: type II toxin-antitoxin system HipA family toxin [Coriobacteriales bacterium]|nr:type II toxin-antitoxin system HipA family toxin [Coriobacteriales bacterium]